MHTRSIATRRLAPLLLRFTLGAAVPLIALASTQPASAAKAFDTEAVKKQLLSGNSDEITKALETIKAAGAAAKPIVPTLNTLLKKGSTAQLLVVIIQTTSKLEDPSSSAALAPYVRHREKTVRQAAAKALLHTKGPDAIKALRRGLRSRDAVVRGTAAGGLGTLGAKEALPDLFAAFDHKVGEAAVSIGQLCEGESCTDFMKRVGKVPFDIMTSGLDQMLFRPASSLNDEAKIRIIGKLRELGTGEAGKYLADVAERWPKDWSKRVKAALDAAVKAVGKGRTGDDDDEDDDE
ncbi:MAG: HEAT repeat domain-containing protein [Polyangiaceae bacterium]